MAAIEGVCHDKGGLVGGAVIGAEGAVVQGGSGLKGICGLEDNTQIRVGGSVCPGLCGSSDVKEVAELLRVIIADVVGYVLRIKEIALFDYHIQIGPAWICAPGGVFSVSAPPGVTGGGNGSRNY